MASLEGKRLASARVSQGGNKMPTRSSITLEGKRLASVKLSGKETGFDIVTKDGKRLGSVKLSKEGKELRLVPEECSVCVEGNPPKTYCPVCTEFLCGDCTKFHRRIKKTRDHELAEITTPEVVCSLCDDAVQTYCHECEDFLCTECTKHHRKSRKSKDHILKTVNANTLTIPPRNPKQHTSISTDKPAHFSPRQKGPSHYAQPKQSNRPGPQAESYQFQFPTKLELLNTTPMGSYYYISKHVAPESFLARRWYNGPVKRLSYTGAAEVLGQPTEYQPEPVCFYDQSILTISDERHVIVSRKGIHLCFNGGVITSQPHVNDEYIPDRITMVDKDKLVTVCTQQTKIRYHDSRTLELLNTYGLTRAEQPNKPINLYRSMFADIFILCTTTRDILLQTGVRELSQFTAEGEMKRVVPVHEDFFRCNGDTVCIDMHNNIFGVEFRSGRIHVFGLEGEHQFLGRINNVAYVRSSGLDSLGNLYVACETITREFFLVKYRYYN